MSSERVFTGPVGWCTSCPQEERRLRGFLRRRSIQSRLRSCVRYSMSEAALSSTRTSHTLQNRSRLGARSCWYDRQSAASANTSSMRERLQRLRLDAPSARANGSSPQPSSFATSRSQSNLCVFLGSEPTCLMLLTRVTT